MIQAFPLTLDTLFYDTTNFFTYIASGNDRSTLAQRGHSKQKRTDLRQFSLALLVARDGQIPLYAHVYEGNVVDAQQFPDALTAIRQRVEKRMSVFGEQLWGNGEVVWTGPGRLDDVLYRREEAAPEVSIVYGLVEE